MFLTEDDFRVVVGETTLKVLSQASPDIIANAEAEAIDEIAGYLLPAYDSDAIFTASGDFRNRLIVMYTVDIVLYHLSAALPQKMGSEIRKERYERAIKWLEGVQAGRIVQDLPVKETEDASCCFGTSFRSSPKLRHDW